MKYLMTSLVSLMPMGLQAHQIGHEHVHGEYALLALGVAVTALVLFVARKAR